MQVKVCGLKHPNNIEAILAAKADFVGFIFYEKSSRFVGEDFSLAAISNFPKEIKKVGVFVDAPQSYILSKVALYQLDFVQLHGKETSKMCQSLQQKGVKIIKTFPVKIASDFALCTEYEAFCDFFLFDTKGEKHGGNGVKFDWGILESYKGKLPIFLSGGIDENDAQEVKKAVAKFKQLNIKVIDINSKFETAPALKNADKVAHFIKEIKN